jgi:tRNA U34 5-methylaminomethyl-2-thiouridine-forming methyltransferase MnmC
MSASASDISIYVTRDGSHSMYSEQFRQFYHNPNGAYSESLHVFFEQSGLSEKLKNNEAISVFETGFGTGLNALILADLAESFNSSSEICFESVEAWPISASQASELNYSRFCRHAEINTQLPEVFRVLEDNACYSKRTGRIRLTVHKCFFDDLSDEKLLHPKYTHIFHDPFSPEVNRELWMPEVFSKLRTWSNPDVVLSTYCAAVPARAAMAVAGWKVAKAAGALGKREMTLASPDESILSGLKRINEIRLSERWENGEFRPD